VQSISVLAAQIRNICRIFAHIFLRGAYTCLLRSQVPVADESDFCLAHA